MLVLDSGVPSSAGRHAASPVRTRSQALHVQRWCGGAAGGRLLVGALALCVWWAPCTGLANPNPNPNPYPNPNPGGRFGTECLVGALALPVVGPLRQALAQNSCAPCCP